ncbi:hypothetical protein [Vogesella oryzae]|uniref:hypothetical protein n=1 Tax=Vogesella oryzae TaxID=1735285 RepID=UPI0015843490|nr:hypothetical protein [Vogesella oryzae]
MKHQDITNQTFGSITAIRLAHIATDPDGDKREYWIAKCICGHVFTRRKDGITGCKSTSCTCKRAKGAVATNALPDKATTAPEDAATTRQAIEMNRRSVPSSMRTLVGRIIPARHTTGCSFSAAHLPGGHSSAFATMEAAP